MRHNLILFRIFVNACRCHTFNYYAIWYWPKIYIIVKQLSNANPTIKRHTENIQKFVENAVAIPPTKPNKFDMTNEGIRPYRSAIQPNNKPPTIAPQKKIDCAIDGSAELSQTHSNCKTIKTIKINLKWMLVQTPPQIAYFSWNGRIRNFDLIKFPSIFASNSFPAWIRFCYSVW